MRTGSLRSFPRGRLVLAALGSVVLGLGGLESVPAQEKPVPGIMPHRPVAPETLSSSQQFLLHGATQAERAAVVTVAEQIREEFSALLDRQEPTPTSATDALDAPATPLVIDIWLQPGVRPPVQTRLYVVEGQTAPTLGLAVERADLAASEEFRREVIRLLLIERIVRGNEEVDFTRRTEVLPAWIFAGVRGALDYARQGRPSGRFAAMFKEGLIMPVEDILETNPDHLTAPEREVFEVSACSLILLLNEQSQGPTRFRRFLHRMPRLTTSHENQLVRSFPGLALSQHSLEKWWALHTAQLAQPTIYEKLSAAATEERLAKALVVRWQPEKPRSADSGLATKAAATGSAVGQWFKKLLPKKKPPSPGAPATETAEAPVPVAAAEAAPESEPKPEVEVIPLTDLDRLARLPKAGRERAIQVTQLELAALALQAFPLHQPVLDGYQQILGSLLDGDTAHIPAMMADLATRRRELLDTAAAMEDHLNWYEATQRSGATGAFDGYFRLLDQLSQPPPRLPDPFSLYLDEIEEEFRR